MYVYDYTVSICIFGCTLFVDTILKIQLSKLQIKRLNICGRMIEKILKYAFKCTVKKSFEIMQQILLINLPSMKFKQIF